MFGIRNFVPYRECVTVLNVNAFGKAALASEKHALLKYKAI
jgi:hypothetical protein